MAEGPSYHGPACVRVAVHYVDGEHAFGSGEWPPFLRSGGKTSACVRRDAAGAGSPRPEARAAGLRLHQYANLYFHARNPMLYKRLDEVASLCVLRISLDVLDVPGIVITDSNAASDYVRFLHPSQWALINFDDVFAESWTHSDDHRRYFQHKSRKCAEVLVPRRMSASLIIGAYVINGVARSRLTTLAPQLPVTVDPYMFFQANPS